MPKTIRRVLLLVATAATVLAAVPSIAMAKPTPGRYIVVLEDSVDRPGAMAEEAAERHGAKVSHVYRTALKGYAARMSAQEAKALERDPRVASVEPDRVYSVAAQTVPTGIRRVFAPESPYADIDGLEDPRVDADIAVFDAGVQFDHPDLNVVARIDCALGDCVHGAGEFDNHGTQVAGVAAALDNATGVVGVAPGARLWSVDMFYGPLGFMSALIRGLDWVTARADQIEVVNMSIQCTQRCALGEAERLAIAGAVDAGVVVVVAAGNHDDDVQFRGLPSHPDVITVSALADDDGLPGALDPPSCFQSEDDTLASFSNWGAGVDIAAPGTCIETTTHGGGYFASFGGTSAAAPHVAGAAALLASRDNPSSRQDVMDIRQKLVDEGNFDWTDDSGPGSANDPNDGVHEPLLDLRFESAGFETGFESDVDGDGRSDLVSLGSSGGARVFEGANAGIGAGSPVSSLSGLDPALLDGAGAYLVDVSDVDGDLRSDLVTLGVAGGVSVHRGQSDGTFGAAVGSYAGSLQPAMTGNGSFEPFAASDVDGDNRADLVGLSALGFPYVIKGQATGQFGSGVTSSWLFDSASLDGAGSYPIDVADVTGDGKADLVSMDTAGSVRVYKGQADGKFAASSVAAASVDPVMDDGTGHEPVGLGDVDGDARADLVTLDGAGVLKFFEGQADGTFAAPITALSGTIDSSLLDGAGEAAVGLLDYNGDRRADLVTVDDSGTVRTYGANVYVAGFGPPVVQTGTVPAVRHGLPGQEFGVEKPFLRRAGCEQDGCRWRVGGPTESDVDGDGHGDLVTAHSSGGMRVFAGADDEVAAGSSVSSAAGLDPALLDGSGEYLVDVSDMDGDGRSDLITQGSAGGFSLRRGRDDRTFGSATTSLTGWKPVMNGSGTFEPVAADDVNNDGRGDVVGLTSTIFGIDLIQVFKGQANDTFASPVSSSVAFDSALTDGDGAYAIDVADVSPDGRGDLIVMETSGSVRVYRGQSDAQFALDPPVAATIDPVMDDGTGHEPVGVGDVDDDGFPDLVTLDGSGTLKLYRGQIVGWTPNGLDLNVLFAEPVTAYSGTLDSSLLDGTGLELVGLLDYNRDNHADLVAIDDDGQVLSYPSTGSGFGSPTTHPGPIATVSHAASGHEPVLEKPFLRRVGCTATGCH